MVHSRASLIVALAVIAATAVIEAQQAPPPPPKPVGDNVDVPIVMRGPQPTVSVMVNGKGPYLFAIDTAASGVGRADTSLVSAAGLAQVGEARASDGSGAAPRVIPIVRVDKLELADVSWTTADLASRDYNTSANLPAISGILGFQAFSGMLVTIDMPHKRFRLTRGELPAADGKTILALDRRRPIPSIEIDINGQKLLADIDTGNIVGDGLNLPASIIASLTLSAPPVVAGTGRTVNSSFELKRGMLKGTISLGALTLVDPPVFYSEGIERTNIGMGVMKDLVITFDTVNGRVKFERA